MSTLSSVYNMVSSIFARDMYSGMVRRELNDQELLKVGRRASIAIGLIVVGLAVVFVTSQFGIFNLMQAFFTLFNIPVVIPMAFGLIFRRVPKWSAVGGITWGLLAGVTGRYLLGWDIGPQVYLSFVMTFGIFATSSWTAGLHRNNKPLLVGLSVAVAALTGLLFTNTVVNPLLEPIVPIAWGVALAFGASLYFFAGLFTREVPEEQARVAEFFKKLDTPVDVAREVFGAGKKQVSVFPLVGATMLIMAALVSLVFFTELDPTEQSVLGALVAMMAIFGALLWYFGKRSEIRGAAGEASR
jgi:Na+/proline symporter